MKYSNCPMSSSLSSSFQENTKCESSFFADTCTRRVPIFILVVTHQEKENFYIVMECDAIYIGRTFNLWLLLVLLYKDIT